MKHFMRLGLWVGILWTFTGCGTAGKPFDAEALDKIVNGTTTQAEVERLLGPPFKKGWENDKPVWIYEYNKYQMLGRDESKDIIIKFDKDGVVRSHQFMTSQASQ